ncbi:MAG TPA: MIP/aquaporin family protein [Candidatus Acidoferrales bacterium]|nr:MIP/aquaporin family protein [Candidatus Acidoferrales bacterium]
MTFSLSRRLAAEFIGTAFLLAAIVGSGIMAERLSGSNVSLCLLENTLATGAALVALILAFSPVSGAHLNPAVTLASAWTGGIPWAEVAPYGCAQVSGGIAGVYVTHLMFGLPAIQFSQHARSGSSQFLSECVATFGLLAVIQGCARARPESVAYAVGAYITGAYWFTASTAFANPAVTLARALSDTFTGIRPADVAPFLAAQLSGAAAAAFLYRWLVRVPRRRAAALPAVPELRGAGEIKSP